MHDAFNADDTLAYLDPPVRRTLKQVAVVVSLLMYAAYLVYRARYTLNHDALVFSILVYLAELHGGLSLFFYYFQLWAPRRRVVPLLPAEAQPFTVDVFITTYNEDITLLRQTARAAVGMRYPHRTWLLDDGRRPEVAALAGELGCGYLTRETNEHAKAGNWNNAFRHTTGEIILTLDADHVPRPEFLERTLGFFQDPRVFIVQVPQQFHNLDSVQHQVNWEERRMYGEQDVFFDLVMPGKDHWNASFFCGTGALLRRAALAPHGGILTGSITEDMHTSMVLHAEGWKAVYLNETLVTGLAPSDIQTFLKQRLRWAEGNLKLIRDVNPLTRRGLSLPQRISYLSSIFHWTIGLPKLVFYLAPPWMLFSGTFPIAPFDRTVVTIYLANMVCLIATYKLLSRGRGRILMDEFFNMLNTFTLLQALGRLLLDGRKVATFVVTDKKGGAASGKDVLPHYALLGFSVLALNWSLLGLGFGVRDDLFGAGIGVFWTLYNMALVVGVVRLARRPRQKRDATRFRASFPVTTPALSAQMPGLTADLSESGCRLLWPATLPAQSRHTFDLHLLEEVVRVEGEVVTVLPDAREGWSVLGVSFVDPSPAVVDAISDVIFDAVVPELLGGLRQASWPVRVWQRCRLWWQPSYATRALRARIARPARIDTGVLHLTVSTRDISGSGLSVVSPEPLGIGTAVTLDVMAPSATWVRHGVVARVRPINARGRRTAAWDIGVRFVGESLAQRPGVTESTESVA